MTVVPVHLGVVAHPAQQAVGRPRRAPAAAGDLQGPVLVDADAQDARAAGDDDGQFLGRIEIQVADDAEAAAQGRRDQTRPAWWPRSG